MYAYDRRARTIWARSGSSSIRVTSTTKGRVENISSPENGRIKTDCAHYKFAISILLHHEYTML